MELRVPKKLIELAKMFNGCGKELFMVGGYVRNAILKIYNTDLDICSSIKNEEIINLLKGTKFKFKLQSEKLGTSLIYCKNFKAEHTTFRSETYLVGGVHSPNKVQFESDIKKDSSRRDFTINSLYWSPTEKKVIDFFGGINDLNNKTIKAILTPEQVFKSDGLRILRMVRLACELNFKIDKHTFDCAKKMIGQLNDISHSRITKEFELILNSNKKYKIINNTKSHLLGVEKLIELGALNKIFNFNQEVKISNLVLTKKVGYKFALFAIVYDLFKKTNISPNEILSFYELASDQKREIVEVLNAVETFNNLDFSNVSIFNHYAYLPKVLKLLYHISRSNYFALKSAVQNFENKNLPTSIKDLKVNGQDLINIKIEEKKIGVTLNKLLQDVLLGKIKNNRTDLLKELR